MKNCPKMWEETETWMMTKVNERVGRENNINGMCNISFRFILKINFISLYILLSLPLSHIFYEFVYLSLVFCLVHISENRPGLVATTELYS